MHIARKRHRERHVIGEVNWLRAAVLGAHDGILSTASLIVGVVGASPDARPAVIAGVAGLVAGALSMAAGEFVSVSSQADLEAAELAREQRELHEDPEGELKELAGIYRGRGLSHELAHEVAQELTEHDALDAHARDELGLTDIAAARPVQAAAASAASFTAGAIVPVAVVATVPFHHAAMAVIGVSILLLVVLGAMAARIGRAPLARSVTRVVLLGAAAMLVTLGLGRLFGTTF